MLSSRFFTIVEFAGRGQPVRDFTRWGRNRRTRLSALLWLRRPKKKKSERKTPFALRGKISVELFQFRQHRLDGFKVRQVFRRRRLFAVLHHALFINHEGRARRRVADRKSV